MERKSRGKRGEKSGKTKTETRTKTGKEKRSVCVGRIWRGGGGEGRNSLERRCSFGFWKVEQILVEKFSWKTLARLL
jgi:hypothetical protein